MLFVWDTLILFMPILQISTSIAAPVERVFDLARSIDLHQQSATGTGERAVAGRTLGLLGLNEEVTWRGRHFGIWQKLTVCITAMDRPVYFSDEMVRGAFRRMEHQHYFVATSEGTLMRDVFSFTSPLGILGRLADVLFLKRHMREFIVERNRILKETAETAAWQRYI
jgi:ligand-binding SRPBCC domain-containing protein